MRGWGGGSLIRFFTNGSLEGGPGHVAWTQDLGAAYSGSSSLCSYGSDEVWFRKWDGWIIILLKIHFMCVHWSDATGERNVRFVREPCREGLKNSRIVNKTTR